jgi:hypothetical protein
MGSSKQIDSLEKRVEHLEASAGAAAQDSKKKIAKKLNETQGVAGKVLSQATDDLTAAASQATEELSAAATKAKAELSAAAGNAQSQLARVRAEAETRVADLKAEA